MLTGESESDEPDSGEQDSDEPDSSEPDSGEPESPEPVPHLPVVDCDMPGEPPCEYQHYLPYRSVVSCATLTTSPCHLFLSSAALCSL